MKEIRNILEDEGVKEFLAKRGIVNQYKKGAKYILSKTYSAGLDFKERQPTGSNIWSFRI
ncbi:MAG: hypothetical protein CO170_00725 [candidate division SR1 bacterium CG_4_9_14_3_um_filter_40_9]|nr:MAG: hypothetical protein CO170_00725 [candidate division SR1 bacterium CG_4_9_14_3_um_filter_40_9]